ncbi:serine O-acetyltransferase [Paracoccus sp. (in: a-proteobacteria)]|uniref:serine O-acetyltransferase n=1 Tax=Paracoccus sp. TaxID=267 RepID=UPI003A889569
MSANPLTDSLLPAARELFSAEPALATLFGFDPAQIVDLSCLFAAVLGACLPQGPARDQVRAIAADVFARNPEALEIALDDLLATTARDQAPGGAAQVLHFAHGYHALLSYRLTRALWLAGREAMALAIKGQFSRALAVEIWPQARIGRGVWLDHGLGVVIGQTAVIEEDVSLWHGVTLGSNFVDMGEGRHPVLRRGAVIGAGALILGPVEIGAGAIVAAGAIVTHDVPAGHLVTGPRAGDRGNGRFGGFVPLRDLKRG